MEKFKFESNNPETEDNIYTKEKFLPERATEYVEKLVSNFKEHYTDLGYKEESPVEISSGTDPTVRFIGSHISVFKPYLINDNVPNPGLLMEQPCIRTRNVNKLLDDEYFLAWGSYFLRTCS